MQRRTDRIRELEAENERLEAEIARLRRQNTRLKENADATTTTGSHNELEAKLRVVTEERDNLQQGLKKVNKYISSLLANDVSSQVIFCR